MKEKKQILCFSVEHKKETRIQDVCRKLGIQTKTVSGEQYGCALGYLAGIPGIPVIGQDEDFQGRPPLSSPFMAEMLVFSGINSDELDVFLEAYKDAGIPPVPLKAILTPTNVFWSAHKLYRVLWAEHH